MVNRSKIFMVIVSCSREAYAMTLLLICLRDNTHFYVPRVCWKESGTNRVFMINHHPPPIILSLRSDQNSPKLLHRWMFIHNCKILRLIRLTFLSVVVYKNVVQDRLRLFRPTLPLTPLCLLIVKHLWASFKERL